MVGDEIGSPGVDRAAVAKVAVRNGCSFGPGGPAGDDVALVVTDVKCALWRATDNFAGVKDG